MTDWHLATVFEAIADTIGDRPALICGDVTRSWSEFDDRSARLATMLTQQGLGVDSKVGIYLHNSNEYLEAHHGIMKIRGCPINTNYRYEEEELVYLLNNADVEAIFYQSTYASRIDAIRDRLDKVKCYIQVEDGSCQPLLEGAQEFETAIATAEPMPRIERFSDDLYMFYTGGTTGMPKGVMYNIGDHCALMTDVYATINEISRPETINDLVETIRSATTNNALPVGLICCPLMHATGMWTGAMLTQLSGGAVVTVDQLGFDADRFWREAEKHRASTVTLVGDAMASQLLDALDKAKQNNDTYDLSSIKYMASSGVMWSKEIKEGLLAHHDMLLVDTMGSTEGSMGLSLSSREMPPATAKFALNKNVKVYTEDGREVVSGSDEIGMIATQNEMLGYYKDPEKTAQTVREIDGKRWVFPGDYATVRADGTIDLWVGGLCVSIQLEKRYFRKWKKR